MSANSQISNQLTQENSITLTKRNVAIKEGKFYNIETIVFAFIIQFDIEFFVIIYFDI